MILMQIQLHKYRTVLQGFQNTSIGEMNTCALTKQFLMITINNSVKMKLCLMILEIPMQVSFIYLTLEGINLEHLKSHPRRVLFSI